MTSEADVVRHLMTTLSKIPGVFCFRTHGGAFQMKGTPDVVGCARGVFFAIEVKKGNGKATPAQLFILSKIEEAGGKTFVTNDKDGKEIIGWIKRSGLC